MPKLTTMLHEHDEGILPTLGSVWQVTLTNLKPKAQLNALESGMQDATTAEKIWEALNDDERQALQTLLASQLTMPAMMFKRLYGDIRKMGKGQIEREQPHKKPSSIAESLFYKGLIGEQFAKLIYIPDEIAAILPSHKTAYEGIESDPLPAAPTQQIQALMPVEEEYIEDIQAADTSIVDDLCTLLAYLRNHSAGVVEDEFLPVDIERLSPYLLNPSPVRLHFLLGIGASADLITTQDGRAYPKRSHLQKWLDNTRSQQLKTLLDAWFGSTLYRDLWHVRGLYVEPDAGFPYDPLIGRQALLGFLKQIAPPTDWFAVDEFIDAVKIINADFQRPNGDYESWYIRNDAGDYLHGFESWDAIEGALLDYYLRYPMHWLGLTDTSEEAVRLTAYGRAFLELMDWPQPPDPNELLTIEADGVLVVSRRVSRMDRFQVARFSTWGTPQENQFYYRLDADGVQQAAQQQITTAHISTFLHKHANGQPLPERVQQLLTQWQETRPDIDEVTLERLLILRTVSPETLNRLYDDPTVRQFLGAKLGAMACIVRADQQEALKLALGDTGITVHLID